MSNNMFTELTISGMWIGHGVQEDCVLLVGWCHGEMLPDIIAIEDCRGTLSGTNFMNNLVSSPMLMDHLRDMICERFEV